ncbi:unnamed protein product, partial [Bubo scandiacus]
AGGRRGKWARRALHGGWQRCSCSTCPGCREGDGAVLDVAPPAPPRTPLGRAGEEGNHPPTHTPPPAAPPDSARGRTAVWVPVGTSPAVSGGGGLALLGKAVA